MNATAVLVFVLLFILITWLGFVAARWRKGDLDLLHEWGLGGRRFGTFVTWFLLGGDLYTAYTFIAVPALLYGAGAIGFFAVPYTVMIYPILYLVFPRLWKVCHRHGYVTSGGFRARPVRQPLAGAGDRGYRHPRYYAVHRVAACWHAGGDRGTWLSDGGAYGRSAADHRIRDPGGVHLYLRPARAGDDRGGEGPADLHHRDCRDHRGADPARRVRQNLCGHSRAQAAAGASAGRLLGRFRHLCDAGARLGTGAVPVSAFDHRYSWRFRRPGDPPQRRAAAGLFADAGLSCAARVHGGCRGACRKSRVCRRDSRFTATASRCRR